MSQTNPRSKAVLRNDASSTPTMSSNPPPAPVHHPLPQHPHTHIPPHLKRGGKPKAPEESPEIKALKAKYGKDKLATLKEIYPAWSDDDLLMTLQEANGSVEIAVTRIAEGELMFSYCSDHRLLFVVEMACCLVGKVLWGWLAST